ncbi:hypothetical protein GEMRC1_007390 [Eukaryota sp. GEM-RC1]
MSYSSSDEDDYAPASFVLSGAPREALRQDILEQLESTKSLLKEKQNELNIAKTNKDDLAVQLYSRQRELGITQTKLDDISYKIEDLQQRRTEHEALRDSAKKTVDETQNDVSEINSNISKLQTELNRLHDALRLASQFEDAEVDHIELLRRATHKGEEELIQLEKMKQAQDLRLKDYSRKLQQQEETLAILTSKIAAQEDEVELARSVLKDASNQIDQIQSDKKHILTQWQSTLIGMQQRDGVLSQVKIDISDEEQKLISCKAELASVNQSIVKSQEESERLSFNLKKSRAELTSLESKLEKIKNDEDRIALEYSKIKTLLGNVEDESADQKKIFKNLTKEKDDLLRTKRITEDSIVKLRQHLSDLYSEGLTVDRSRHHLKDDIEKIQTEILKIEKEYVNQENEKYRIELDIENVSFNVASINQERNGKLKELNDLEEVIKDLEVEIRRRHDNIAKKQGQLQALNKKYENFVSKSQDENYGELEAKIVNLNREIRKGEETCSELEGLWLGKQTELVDRKTHEDKIALSLRNASAKSLILRQRQMRINAHVSSLQKSLQSLERSMDSMHRTMTRVNHFTARLEQNQNELVDMIFNTETDFSERLKELEEQSLTLEDQIAKSRSQKSTLINDIPEAERQIQLFERMIQLQREMEATLDPQADEGVIKTMEQEIQRMKLRLKELKRRQKELTDHMVKTVQKRKYIRLKAQATVNNGKQSTTGLSSTESSKIAKFRRQMQFSDEQVSSLSIDISDLRDSENQLSHLIENIDSECKQLTETINQLEIELFNGRDLKEQLVLRTSKLQAIVRAYMPSSQSSSRLSSRSRPSSSASRPTSAMSVSSTVSQGSGKLEQIVEDTRKLGNLLNQLIDDHQLNDDAFERVKRLRNIALSAQNLLAQN